MRKSEDPGLERNSFGGAGGTTNQQDNVHLMYIQQIKKQNGHLPVENQTKGTNNLQKHYTGDLQKGTNL